jgi:hypothetical protein
VAGGARCDYIGVGEEVGVHIDELLIGRYFLHNGLGFGSEFVTSRSVLSGISDSCSTVKVSSSRSRASVANISRCPSCVLHDGALRAEIDCPVVGRHGGLDDVAVAQIFRVFGLP